MLSDFIVKIQTSYNNKKYIGNNNKQCSGQGTIIRIIGRPNGWAEKSDRNIPQQGRSSIIEIIDIISFYINHRFQKIINLKLYTIDQISKCYDKGIEIFLHIIIFSNKIF